LITSYLSARDGYDLSVLRKLLERFRKPQDPKVVAEKERIRREAQQAAIRADADAARHRNYGGLP
jgi:hypothetical protein